MSEGLWTITDVADWFGVNETTIFQWMKTEHMPASCVDNEWKFSEAALEN